MKKEVNICDICKIQLSLNICFICNRDYCEKCSGIGKIIISKGNDYGYLESLDFCVECENRLGSNFIRSSKTYGDDFGKEIKDKITEYLKKQIVIRGLLKDDNKN